MIGSRKEKIQRIFEVPSIYIWGSSFAQNRYFTVWFIFAKYPMLSGHKLRSRRNRCDEKKYTHNNTIHSPVNTLVQLFSSSSNDPWSPLVPAYTADEKNDPTVNSSSADAASGLWNMMSDVCGPRVVRFSRNIGGDNKSRWRVKKDTVNAKRWQKKKNNVEIRLRRGARRVSVKGEHRPRMSDFNGKKITENDAVERNSRNAFPSDVGKRE